MMLPKLSSRRLKRYWKPDPERVTSGARPQPPKSAKPSQLQSSQLEQGERSHGGHGGHGGWGRLGMGGSEWFPVFDVFAPTGEISRTRTSSVFPGWHVGNLEKTWLP